MLDMCKYNEASQHDSTTQVLYLRLRQPYITYTKVRVTRPSIQSTQVKHKRKLNMSEYRHLEMKKAEKPDYLPDPAEGSRS